MQVALRATERMDEGGEVSELWIIKQATEEDSAVTLDFFTVLFVSRPTCQ